jgi:hypothetical protein
MTRPAIVKPGHEPKVAHHAALLGLVAEISPEAL